MNAEYDAVILGGAFSGAATAIVLKRKHPSARVLLIEKFEEFDRKVGESTTELSSCYMTRILGLTEHLGHHQLSKQGLRLWFSNRVDQAFDDCVELGGRYQARLPTFQVDRATLDAHLLERAAAAGCEVWRPAKVIQCELNQEPNARLNVRMNDAEHEVRARWVVDATGRAAFLSRKLGHFRANTEHPIDAVWSRFTGTKEWDSYEWRERFPDYANACRTSRSWATNHLMGNGWWCWIIPLRGGDVSAGVVFDSRIFSLPEGANLGDRLRAHILAHPVGREIFSEAKIVPGDVHAFSAMPYHSAEVAGGNWAIVGDAAGFIDPLYSPGLDFCSYTTYCTADFIARDLQGEDVSERVTYYNKQYPLSYRHWFETLYRNKYFYMGDADLMSAAFLLDVSSYFIGLVIPVYRDPELEFLRLPFEGKAGELFAGFMKFYNRRLVRLAQRRLATGYFGRNNAGWRELYDGFTPDFRLRKMIRRGLFRWLKCELINLRLIFSVRKITSAGPVAATSPQACEV